MAAHVEEVVDHAVGERGDGVEVLFGMAVAHAVGAHARRLGAANAGEHVLEHGAVRRRDAEPVRREAVDLAAELAAAAGVVGGTENVEQLVHAEVGEAGLEQVRRQRRRHGELDAGAAQQAQIAHRAGLEADVAGILQLRQPRPLGADVAPVLAGKVVVDGVLRRFAKAHAGDGAPVIRRDGDAARGEEHLVHALPHVHAVQQRAVQIEQRCLEGNIVHGSASMG